MIALPWNGLQWCIEIGASVAVLALSYYVLRARSRRGRGHSDTVAATLACLSVIAALIMVTAYLSFVGVTADHWTKLPYAATPVQSASVPARIAAEKAEAAAERARIAAVAAKRHARFVRARNRLRRARRHAAAVRECESYRSFVYTRHGCRIRRRPRPSVPIPVPPPIRVPPYSGGGYSGGGSTCADGTHSPSTGSGTCSWHGGIAERIPTPTVPEFDPPDYDYGD